LATVTAVVPPGRFGSIDLDKNLNIKSFVEKPSNNKSWINGGFFVMEPEFLKFIKNDNTYLEREPLEAVTQKKQLAAFRHEGFWQCMDTKRDKDNLNKILKRKKIKF
jgi:glucose-1-phosphate cytidylyltransferase